MSYEDTLIGRDKWGKEADTEIVEFFHSRIRELFSERVRETGKRWEEAVFDLDLAITTEDIERFEQELLDTGYRYVMSAQISREEAPEKYQAPAEAEEPAEAAAPGERTEVGAGANVLRQDDPVQGVARFVSTTETVMGMLLDGVPDETIAVIDDAGGTLTAPIIEDFRAIICLGGTVRSHLAILAREFHIPCLMDAQIKGLKDGDRIEVDYTVKPPAKTEAGLKDSEPARVWKLA